MVLLFVIFFFVGIICYSTFLSMFPNYLVNKNFWYFVKLIKFKKIKFDWITVLVGLMLIICFSYVLGYTYHYFGDYTVGTNLNKIICLFVGVMLFLVCTRDFLSTLLFWEYLGVVRFFLILFYGNYLSLRSRIITLVSSRFGDVCLFLLITYSYYLFKNMLLRIGLIFFIVFTKRAGFPFISWLLEAMRAPTPVSSLVHSSTLVAAGIWFIMRYNSLELFDNMFVFSVFLIITIFITGFSCFFFFDLKKIVALSTCNKISWCVIYLIFGDVYLSLFQLVSHGVSKCMLFILVGDVMSGSGGSQPRNCVYSPRLYRKWGIFSIFSVVLGLSGAPFIGVFFTKHIMLIKFKIIWKVSLLVAILVCVFLSYFYSFRLCTIILKIKSRISAGVLFFFNFWLIMYFWLFIKFFIRYSMDEYYTLIWQERVLLIIFQVISFIIACLFYKKKLFSKWRSRLFGCDKVIEFTYCLSNSILSKLKLFLYRWDSYSINTFNKLGIRTINVFKKKILNMIIFSGLFFIMWFAIVY